MDKEFTTAEKTSVLGDVICILANNAKRYEAASGTPTPPRIERRLAVLKAIARDLNNQLKAEKPDARNDSLPPDVAHGVGADAP